MPSSTSSSDVEMTSYALLTYLLTHDLNDALRIVRWLVSQSNSLGAYSSTQNTVLALQALSEFGLRLMLDNQLDLNILVDVELKPREASITSSGKHKLACECCANYVNVVPISLNSQSLSFG